MGKANPRKGSPLPAESGAGRSDLPSLPGVGSAAAGSGSASATATIDPAAALPPTEPARQVEALRVGPPDIPAVSIDDRKPYWIGVLPRAPLHSWTSPGSGARFVRHTGPQNDRGQFVNPALGQVVMLTDAQRDATLEAVRKHVVRTVGGSGKIWTVGYHDYRHDPVDQPLGKWLFMYPLDKDAPHNRPVKDPMSPEPLYRE